MDQVSEAAVEKPSGSDPVHAATPVESIDVDSTLTSLEYRKLIWKIDLRLLPPLFTLWFISLIDRVNIGAARIQGLEKDLGMDPNSNQFNIATGMCFDNNQNEKLPNLFVLVVVFIGLMVAEVIETDRIC